jgi:DNA-binding CsgD family transcriptional regulator
MNSWLETVTGERHEVGAHLLIGRAPECQLRLADRRASRRHALIYQHGGQHWIMDFGSRNGVFVNHQRVVQPQPLLNGQRIRAGDAEWTFRKQVPKAIAAMERNTRDELDPTEGPGAVFAAAGHALIVLDRGSHVQSITDCAQAWLSEYFTPPPTAGSLPATLLDWVNARANPLTEKLSPRPPPLVVARGPKQLVVRLAPVGREQRLLLLSEEHPPYSVELLKGLGLTQREAEVLHWVAEGKTNSEIGTILGVSTHTVNKHTEHIFAKLEVDNRQRALRTVLERLGRL